MGVSALVLGISALVLCVIPSFSVTQALGGVLALVAVVLGELGRRRVVYKHQSSAIAVAGLVLGLVGLLANGAVFVACQHCQHQWVRGVEAQIQDVTRH